MSTGWTMDNHTWYTLLINSLNGLKCDRGFKYGMKLLIHSQTLKLQPYPVKVWEGISKFIAGFIEHVIIYPCWD